MQGDVIGVATVARVCPDLARAISRRFRVRIAAIRPRIDRL